MEAGALSRKSRGVLVNVASREWQMIEVVRQFGLLYKDQAQGVLGSLAGTPSLLSRVIESQGQNAKIVSIRDRVYQVLVTKAGPFTQMVVLDIGDGLWLPS